MSILIQNVLLADQSTDLLIEGNRIARIAPEIPEPSGATLIDGSHQAILPGPP